MSTQFQDLLYSMYISQDCVVLGRLGGSAVERLPSTQGEILEFWDRVPHRAPCMEPASPSACVSASLSLFLSLSLSLCVCVSHE